MKKLAAVKEQENRDIINVIDEFDYSTQSESYNKRFIEWRSNKNNPYAYNFTLNKKESVYIAGQGFVSESAEKAEIDVLGRILYLLGIAMLAVAFIENIFDKVLVQILDMLGFNIHITFFNSTIYGGRVEVAVVLVIITSLKLLLPAGIIHSRLKMKPALSLPMSLKEPGELIGSISAALIVCAVISIPSAYSEKSKEIYTFFSTYSADVSSWGQTEFLMYTVFDVIVVSVLFEIVFRGGIFTALRQFGDVYAVLVTSVISGLIMQDFRTMAGTIIISVVSAVGFLRSGTVFTAIAVRITYKMYFLALYMMEMSSSENKFINRNFFMAAVFIVGVIVFISIYTSKKRNGKRMFARFETHTSLKTKAVMPFKCLPLAAVGAACLLAAFVAVVR